MLWHSSPLCVQGQDTAPISGPIYTAGTSANLFAAPSASQRVDGWLIQLPDGWTMEGVTVLRYGSERVTSTIRAVDDAPPHTHAIVLGQRQQGPHDVIVNVTVGPSPGRQAWSLTPFIYEPMGYRSVQESQRFEREVRVRSELSDSGGEPHRALSLASDEPVLVRTDVLPPIADNADFTIELWLKTTGLDEVVLSTWTGSERETYPLELMVDASGRLRYYCGQQGKHRSLTTRAPVADGRWHHVAVVHRAAQQRIVLLREGQPVDSLTQVRLPASTGSHLAIGGRVPAAPAAMDAQDTPSRAYSGQLDELRFWDMDRSAAAVRATARRVLPSASQPGLVQLRFEEGAPPDEVDQWPASVQQVPSTLLLNAPLRDLAATVEEGTVHLSWDADPATTDVFVIERSMEGEPFRPVGRVRPAASGDGATQQTFSDPQVDGHVVYYRIRQRFLNGTERVSGTLKIGLGVQGQHGVSLIGNFPNPFSASTTIAYEVRSSQPVQLTVWDLAGQRVTTLVDDTHAPGYYEQSFQAENLPSGTYFVRLQTPTETASHRMVVLK
jgi:hypothetical protein